MPALFRDQVPLADRWDLQDRFPLADLRDRFCPADLRDRFPPADLRDRFLLADLRDRVCPADLQGLGGSRDSTIYDYDGSFYFFLSVHDCISVLFYAYQCYQCECFQRYTGNVKIVGEVGGIVWKLGQPECFGVCR